MVTLELQGLVANQDPLETPGQPDWRGHGEHLEGWDQPGPRANQAARVREETMVSRVQQVHLDHQDNQVGVFMDIMHVESCNMLYFFVLLFLNSNPTEQD